MENEELKERAEEAEKETAACGCRRCSCKSCNCRKKEEELEC